MGGNEMSYYDCDFFEEPFEFNMQVEEFKSSLASSVRKEFLEEMAALKKENEELREFRDNKKKYEQELREAKAEYQRKMEEAERNANNKKIKDLLRTFSVIGYRASQEYKQGPKCDRCDDYRRFHFVSPMGRNMTEECSCAKKICTYSPKEVKLLRFHAGKEIVDTYFEQVGVDEVYDSYSLCAQIYDKTKKPFEDINWVYTVFLQEDDCQKYCDWLNAKKGGAER